jgi:hypothetical protein
MSKKVTKKTPPTWKDSEEKEALRKAIASGEVSTDPKKNTPKEVFCPEFDFGGRYQSFGPRLRSLQSTVGKAQALANHDFSLLQADQEDKTPEIGSNGKPRWDGSAAEQFLRVAVADGVAVKPATLRTSKAVYGRFDGKVFRDHIYQERKTQKWVKSMYPKSHEKMINDARAFANKYDTDGDDDNEES